MLEEFIRSIKDTYQKAKSNFVQRYRGQLLLSFIARCYDIGSFFSWKLAKGGKVSEKKLTRFKDKYKGKRCFIIGNGPSLRKTDLRKLKNEYTFGLNRIYLLFDKLKFKTTFLVSVNDLVIEQSHKDINSLNIPKFIAWKTREYIDMDKNTQFIRTLAEQKFSTDIVRGVWEGATVTYVALQIAYYMGFSEVILIGVDHSFKIKGQPHKEVVSKGDDRDHFSKDYFSKGFRWNLADLDTAEFAYNLTKEAYERNGRKVVDATVGGKLRVFNKVTLEKLLTRSSYKL